MTQKYKKDIAYRCKYLEKTLKGEEKCSKVYNCQLNKCISEIEGVVSSLATKEEIETCADNYNCIDKIQTRRHMPDKVASLNNCIANKCPKEFTYFRKASKRLFLKKKPNCMDLHCSKEVRKSDIMGSKELLNSNECHKKFKTFKNQKKCEANARNSKKQRHTRLNTHKCYETYCKSKDANHP